jgi:hypothetical protein
MSRTDKTRPYWVQLRDPRFPYGLTAWHWHYHSHLCEPDFPIPPTRREGKKTRLRGGCEWWPKYGDHDKVFGRSGWRRNHPSHDGSARMSLRALRAHWLKAACHDREDIDSRQDAPTQRWLCRHWYWD